MKYIRTKDGYIIDVNKIPVPYQIIKSWIDFNSLGRFEIVAQADTIEELCDRFIVFFNGKRKNDQSVLRSYQSAKTYFSRNKKYKLNHIKEIYGAIWTDKGLIYVAKMNERGELELL